jgi:uncharacterized protein (DUF2062 family)
VITPILNDIVDLVMSLMLIVAVILTVIASARAYIAWTWARQRIEDQKKKGRQRESKTSAT